MPRPRLPGLPTISALMLCAMLAAWLGLLGPLDLSTVQNWPTLISALVTAIGIMVAAAIAVRNVKRQIRINILSREEDRIERHLPGLRDARYFLSGFLTYRVSYPDHLMETFANTTESFA